MKKIALALMLMMGATALPFAANAAETLKVGQKVGDGKIAKITPTTVAGVVSLLILVTNGDGTTATTITTVMP
jgi:hypothetical protein